MIPPETGLPVEGCIDALRRALAATGGRAVLRAAPGAGKTTVVPLRLLDEPWLAGSRIVVLEPRRLAARAAAVWMSRLLGEPVGATIGYRMRDERRVGPNTRIEVVTEGILTRQVQRDPALPGVGLVIFDEVHERHLQTDLALALVLEARGVLRPDLRLLAMSATLETARVAALLGGSDGPAPVITSEGRQHPVEVRWAPPQKGRATNTAAATTSAVAGTIVRAVAEKQAETQAENQAENQAETQAENQAENQAEKHAESQAENQGDVLVFLPGAAEIRRVHGALAGALPAGVDVRPLFGALPVADQDLALAGSPIGRRRVVLATDIAETSLTVEGIGVVVDAGLVRSPRYDARTGLTRLHTGLASKASAEQRAGRAGRVAPGIVYRLWSEAEHVRRRPFAEPEITAVDLAGLALELAVWGGDPAAMAFLDPPPPRALEEGRALLQTLGALDHAGRVTRAGRAMAGLPLHPRLARMVTDAPGWAACALATLLEDRDILRGAPVEVDLAERVRLLTDRHAHLPAADRQAHHPAADRQAHHPAADRQALASARRRAGVLARRIGVAPGPVDHDEHGRVLALAYPDRIAQARGAGRFLLRTGTGASVDPGDPLAGEAFLVVADLDAAASTQSGRIRLAAALDAADLESAAGAPIESTVTITWDADRDDLRATVTRHLDRLVLGVTDGPATVGPETTAALVDRVRTTRLTALHWTDGARGLQQRVGFLRRTFGDDWPDLSDAALIATLDDWLAPLLAGATGRADLQRVDVTGALRRLVPRVREIDELAPATIAIRPGRPLRVAYDGDQPTVAIRVQELFGTTRHPTVAGGRVPVVLELLSPAGRPVQVTADLPGFWAGSYAAVRKEMAGRYPKHPWPADPAAALPGRPRIKKA